MSTSIDHSTLSKLTWEHFSGSAPDCFELAEYDADRIVIRNRTAPDAGIISGTKSELRDLVEAAKAGQLDKYLD